MQPYIKSFVTPPVSAVDEQRINRTVQTRVLPACILALTLLLVWSQPLLAQTPQSFRIPRTPLEDTEREGEPADLQGLGVQRIILDTDPGVDDAAALVWLLSQPYRPVELLGVVTVAGNTSQENATNNARLVLSWLERSDIPVIPGADKPLKVQPSSTGQLIHGADGLWGLGTANPQPPLPDPTPSATDFYCSELEGHETEVLVVALGPLTNLAKAMSAGPEQCAVDWSQVQIVSLGGAKVGGNQTPVTEYNYWQDPEAAIQVLASGAQLTLVTLDGFSQFTIGFPLVRLLGNRGVPAIRKLVPALETYVFMLSGETNPALPDPVAAIVAVHRGLGLPQPGLVKILGSEDGPEYVRGQTVIALTNNSAEWLTLAADDETLSYLAEIAFEDVEGFLEGIAAILNENPPNATVVTDILALQVGKVFVQGLLRPLAEADAPVQTESQELGPGAERNEYRLYLPGVEGSAPDR